MNNERERLDESIEEALHFVYSYASDVRDWLSLKKELLKALPAGKRKLFSTRDGITKKQTPNSFEHMLISHWEKITGISLYLDKT